MSSKFVMEFPIRYQDTDPRLRATLTSLVGAMQEAAILHSESLGRGIQWLSDRNLSWMIVQTRAEIVEVPGWKSLVRVATWPSEMGRLLSRREFLLEVDGQPCMRATTLWAFMDTRARRVTRIPAEVGDAYAVVNERPLALPFRRPALADHVDREERFVIRGWQIDFNRHVNNLRYLDWMLETLPAELIESFQLRELNIRYEREAGPGGEVTARLAELAPDKDGRRRFFHQVVLEGGESIAVAETTWVRASS